MLKWAVGQGIQSSASSTNSYLSELNSPIYERNRKRKLRSTESRSTIRTACVCKTVDKENRKRCRKSSRENKMVNSATSPCVRNRGDIYTQLDNIPTSTGVALRDVSNHWSPSCETNGERGAARPRRKIVSRPKTKTPRRLDSRKRIDVPPEPNIPPPPLPDTIEPLTTAEFATDAVIEAENDLESCQNSPINVTRVIESTKRPCGLEHHSTTMLAIESRSSKSPPPPPLLVNNSRHFTVQTSPPEEPDELFHKELPAKRARLCQNCDIVNDDADRVIRLPPSLYVRNDKLVCDNSTVAAANQYEVSTLTKNLSWLELNGEIVFPTLPGLRIQAADLLCGDESPAANGSSATDSNSIVNGGKTRLKRKLLDENAGDTRPAIPADVAVDKLKSKRRCVIFNEQSYPLNTPPFETTVSDVTVAVTENDTRPLSTSSTFDDDDDDDDDDAEIASTLRRQKVIRRKNGRRGNFATVPQSIYNKNLNSWLTLPNGIPGPFEISDNQFTILGATPMSKITSNTFLFGGGGDDDDDDDDEPSDFDVVKKAMSTPKPNVLFDLTEDVFLSPGVRPLLDSVMRTSPSETDVDVESKNDETNEQIRADLDQAADYVVFPEQTWNSHGKHLAKTTTTIDDEDDHEDGDEESSLVDSTQSSNSRINDDQDIISSIVSTPTLASTPTTTTERQSRSRRCLSFVSPPTPKMTSKQNRNETGQLDLRIYYNSGLMTIHIIRAHNLQKHLGKFPCNAYVKMNLIPQGSMKSFHRTCVRKNSFNPKFDHKFSMEISENDLNKRVLISAWHRDRGKQKSEFLGCVSFAVKNILKKEINGRYKLLSHNSNKSFLSQIQPAQDLMAGQITYIIEDKNNVIDAVEKFTATNTSNEKLKPMSTTRNEINKAHDECTFLQYLKLDSIESDTEKIGRTPFTTTRKLIRQSGGSYGFSIAWMHPPRVERVEANSPADAAGLKPGDNVVFVNETNVVKLSKEMILDIIKSCGNQITLEIYRKSIANGILADNVQRSTETIQLPSSRQSPKTYVNRDTRLTTAYSTTEMSTKRLQLPLQITFTSDIGSGLIV